MISTSTLTRGGERMVDRDETETWITVCENPAGRYTSSVSIRIVGPVVRDRAFCTFPGLFAFNSGCIFGGSVA